jgi:hypothetical protein
MMPTVADVRAELVASGEIPHTPLRTRIRSILLETVGVLIAGLCFISIYGGAFVLLTR